MDRTYFINRSGWAWAGLIISILIMLNGLYSLLTTQSVGFTIFSTLFSVFLLSIGGWFHPPYAYVPYAQLPPKQL